MLTIWGGVALVVGAVMYLASALVSIRAYGSDRVPIWTRPSREPWEAAIARGVGAAALVFGATMLSSVIGYWSVAVVAVLMAAGVAMYPLHNRRVARSETLAGS